MGEQPDPCHWRMPAEKQMPECHVVVALDVRRSSEGRRPG